MLPDERENRGERWVLAQIVLFIAYAIVPGGRFAWRSPGTAVALFGVAIALVAAMQLGPGFTPFPQPSQRGRLIATGLYAVVRHPIYSGALLFPFGIAWATHSPGRLLLSCALTVFFDAKTRDEERRLAERYAGYAEYARRVRKFIPRIY